MIEKEQVPLLPAPIVERPNALEPGSMWDCRMQSRIAIFLNDLQSALAWFRYELEHITIHSLRREELGIFIDAIDSQVQSKPVYFLQGTLDAYINILDMARRNPRCNGYRTRFGEEVKKDLNATMAFMYLVGECRGKLMDLYESGEEITDEAIEQIEKALPIWHGSHQH